MEWRPAASDQVPNHCVKYVGLVYSFIIPALKITTRFVNLRNMPKQAEGERRVFHIFKLRVSTLLNGIVERYL
jgi:hypothetical protein